jgi:hypothetical protein
MMTASAVTDSTLLKIAKSLHEKAGECQVFPFVFSSSLSLLFSNYSH